jgi:hypothetical protein
MQDASQRASVRLPTVAEDIRRLAIDVSYARAGRPSEHFALTVEPRSSPPIS